MSSFSLIDTFIIFCFCVAKIRKQLNYQNLFIKLYLMITNLLLLIKSTFYYFQFFFLLVFPIPGLKVFVGSKSL